MNIQLDDWQKKVIEDISKYILICKGRQIGGTTIFAEKAVKRMKEKKTNILVGSITEEQAKLVILMVKDILLRNDKKLIGKKHQKPTLTQITLTNGSTIRSRPVGTMGDAFRGFTADINWFNEASKWPELAFTSIMPTLMTTGGDIWMDSTPFGKKGFFYQSFVNEDNLWKIYYKTSEEVISNRELTEYWTKEKREASLKFLETQKQQLSELAYGQEYLGLFMEELRQFFSDEWINNVCTIEPEENPTPNPNRDYFLGCDIGRIEDPSTFHILDGTDDKNIRQKQGFEIRKIKIPETFREIRRLERIWNFRNIGIDSGGMGAGVLDLLLEDSETKHKSEGLDNASKIIDDDDREKPLLKEDMHVNLLTKGEKGEIKLLNTNEIRASLKSIQYQYLENKMKIFGNDSHHTEGITRAAWLVKAKGLRCFITSY